MSVKSMVCVVDKSVLASEAKALGPGFRALASKNSGHGIKNVPQAIDSKSIFGRKIG